ncbi:MAG: hypothetical protein H0V17_03420 [Deltaproteobacteria bacterium]|nr:hypothetical protein [Deltaproteobacteria bacterium]
MNKIVAFVLLLAACGEDDPVSVSDSVDLKITISSGDVAGGVVSADKNVNTESGNPYGAFVQGARDEIGGDPTRITVDAAALTLEATSSNVAGLGEVFSGALVLGFEMNGSSTVYPIATRTIVAADAGGPLELEVDFDSDSIPDADYVDLASGSFKVSVSGPAAATFEAANADADLLMTLTFSAFE